ncbi:hypothetical protein [Steroidobacter agaridevorans]|uniref:hypothetical protein n=1 Tax=Steroidobacter agaridevorans TaxID=2695856 RepID=UPI001323F359|nr:hypothetical protein [Steroidobacter agaridevorans]GFE89055.1 hypothetical protein GCM10011488_40090 [Steroidobacter agaridevorans]
MADESRFPHDDQPAVESDEHAAERLATPEQWAAMTFAPVLIDLNKFGAAWEQARGVVARTAIELLRLDDRALTSHFMAQDAPLMEAMETYRALQDEVEYLKTHMEALETASTRMLCVASRCVERRSS